MSILMLYLVTIATHWLEFFSSNSGVNEEQFRLKIDSKNKQTNKQKRRTFSLEGGSEEGGGEDCGIHPQSFQYARGKREFKIGRTDYLEKSKVKEKRCI